MIEQTMRSNLMAVALAFANKRDIKLSTLSQLVHGDSPFFDNFSKGRCSITLRKYDMVLYELSKAWPEDLPWPDLDPVPVRRPLTTLKRNRYNGKEEGRKKETRRSKKAARV